MKNMEQTHQKNVTEMTGEELAVLLQQQYQQAQQCQQNIWAINQELQHRLRKTKSAEDNLQHGEV